MSIPSSIDSSRSGMLRRTTEHSDDLEAAGKSLSTDEKAILQVIDAPFDGGLPQVRVVLNSGNDIEDGLRHLPTHESGTARILDVTVHSNFVVTGLRDTKGPKTTQTARDGLVKFLQDTYTQLFEERRLFRWLSDPLLVNDIGSIASQWSQHLSGDNSSLYRIVNRSSLQQDPFDYDVRPRDSYLTCAQDTNDRLIVIIVHDVWDRQTFGIKKTRKAKKANRLNGTKSNELHDEEIHFENPRCTSTMLAGNSLTSFSDGTLENFAKLLVLDFFLASIYLQRVDYYGALIYPKLSEKDVIEFSLTKNPHLQVPLGLFEPRLSAKSSEAFKEIEDAEGILRNVTNLIDSIEFVVAALHPEHRAGSGQTDRRPSRTSGRHWWPQIGQDSAICSAMAPAARRDYEARMQKVQNTCEERGRNAQRALDALNRQLDYLTKRHAIREAKAIKILTILASLYLPLSLSASALSMSSPFKKIAHNWTTQTDEDQNLKGANLLFDFFGVFVGLSVLTIFTVYGIRLALQIRTNGLGILSKTVSNPFSMIHYGSRWRFGGSGGKIFQVLRRITVWWLGAMFCITLLTTFMMGMLKNAQEAWDTARYMFAVYIAVSGLLLLSCIGVYRWLYLKKLQGWRFRWSRSSWLDFCRL